MGTDNQADFKFSIDAVSYQASSPNSWSASASSNVIIDS